MSHLDGRRPSRQDLRESSNPSGRDRTRRDPSEGYCAHCLCLFGETNLSGNGALICGWELELIGLFSRFESLELPL